MAVKINYPPFGFHFRIDFLGFGTDKDAAFQDVSGLSADIGTEDLLEGGVNDCIYKLPVRTKYLNLVLKRGLLSDSALIDWFRNAAEHFIFTAHDLNISILNDQHQPLATWKVKGAYPVRWTISDFKATESTLVIETIEFSYLNYHRE